jgi:hypothetical protein
MSALASYLVSKKKHFKSKILMWLMLIILFLIGIVILFEVVPFSTVEIHSSLFNFLSSFFLLVVTCIYVYFTRQSVLELKNARLFEKAPIILSKLLALEFVFDKSKELSQYEKRLKCELSLTNTSEFHIYNFEYSISIPTDNYERTQVIYRKSEEDATGYPNELLPKQKFEKLLELQDIYLMYLNTAYVKDIEQIAVTITYEDNRRNFYHLKQFYGIRYYKGEEEFGLKLRFDELNLIISEKRKTIKTSHTGELNHIYNYEHKTLYSYYYEELGKQF